MCCLVKRYLQQCGVDLDVAEHGGKALKMVQQKEYDLVLMDLQMPVMDGYETTRKIRQLTGEYFAGLPIIALTASPLEDIRQDILASGMNDCLSKPFNFDDLYQKIRNLQK